jgi:hypothetical protein
MQYEALKIKKDTGAVRNLPHWISACFQSCCLCASWRATEYSEKIAEKTFKKILPPPPGEKQILT